MDLNPLFLFVFRWCWHDEFVAGYTMFSPYFAPALAPGTILSKHQKIHLPVQRSCKGTYASNANSQAHNDINHYLHTVYGGGEPWQILLISKRVHEASSAFQWDHSSRQTVTYAEQVLLCSTANLLPIKHGYGTLPNRPTLSQRLVQLRRINSMATRCIYHPGFFTETMWDIASVRHVQDNDDPSLTIFNHGSRTWRKHE